MRCTRQTAAGTITARHMILDLGLYRQPCIQQHHNTGAGYVKVYKPASYKLRHSCNVRPINELHATPHLGTCLTSEQEVKNYISHYPQLMKFLDTNSGCDSLNNLHIQEMTEGKINHAYCVSGGSSIEHKQLFDTKPPYSAIVLKYAPPHVKSIGSGFPLTQERMRVEAMAMQQLHDSCPEHILPVLYHDQNSSVLVMPLLPPPFMKVMVGLHKQGHTYRQLPDQVSRLLATVAVSTSRMALGPSAHDAAVTQFANTEVVKANEAVVLTDPMDPACTANYKPTTAELTAAIEGFRSNAVVQHAAADLVNKYRQQKQVLLHNDLHTGNLLATQQSLFCIDWEFATYGPAAFDIGCLLATLLLAYVTLGFDNSEGAQQQVAIEGNSVSMDRAWEMHVSKQREWLLKCIQQIWYGYLGEVERLSRERGTWPAVPWSDNHCDAGAGVPTQDIKDMAVPLFQDTIGYASLAMFRLSAGMHLYPGFLFIEDCEMRERRQCVAVQLAQELLHMRSNGVKSIEAVCVRCAAIAQG